MIVPICTEIYRANRSQVQTQLMDMITQWKRSDLDASWEGLADALGMMKKYGPATAKSFRQAVGLPAGNLLCITVVYESYQRVGRLSM